MPYTGGGKFTSWMSLAYSGTPSPYATSEQVPVLTDGTTTYATVIEAATDSADWSSGYTITLTFYDNSNTIISAATQTRTNLVAGTHYTDTTAPAVAPGNASYCTSQVQYNLSPAASNPLDVYALKVVSGANTNIPDILNYNYAFAAGTWPWTPGNGAVLKANYTPLSGSDGNPDSLVIAGIIELMGGDGGVPCAVPDLTDPVSGKSAVFRISTPGGQLSSLSGSTGPYSLGDFQPTQDFVESLLLDGERPFGSRSSNRTMQIPVAIYAPTQQTLNAARDYLLSVIDQQTFEIAWTPKASGLTTIYDCFRALPSTVLYGFNNNREGASGAPAIGAVMVNIQALPYGKSGIDGTVEVDFASHLVSGTPTASVAVLDDFSGAVDTADGWIRNTQYPVTGSNCVFHRNPVPVKSPYPPFNYSSTITSTSIVGLPVLAVWLGQSYDSQWPADPKFVSQVTVSAVLTDVNGNKLGCKTTVNRVPWNANPTKPAWTRISLTVPQKNTKFSYNAVTGYKLTLTNWTGGGQAGYVRMHAWLGSVTASPLSVMNTSSPRGVVYNVFGPPGSAPAPVSTQIQLPNTDPVIQEFTRSGTFQVPVGVSSITTAEAWGGGGAGASVSTSIPGAGGGGAEYARETGLKVTPGQKIPLTVGSGGNPAQLVSTVLTFKTHGVGLTWTCPANVTSAFVECIGAGAAGAPGGGGGGGGGSASRTVTTVPGTTYAMWSGAGGVPNTGTSSQAQATRNGQNTWFGAAGTTSLSGALVGATGGTSPPAGSAEGGSGGVPFNATAGYQGGMGGRSPGPAGGGGGASAGVAALGFPGPGQAGAASPKLGTSGAGDYLTGGAGGTGPGGAGGSGANAPGYAGLPVTPGGGGGGGYTKTVTSSTGTTAVNYQGSKGAPGYVRITYTPGGGAPVHGTASSFGSASTTGTVVTAGGGLSAGVNSAIGGAGGSGSSNAVHFAGGAGSLANRNANMLVKPSSAGTTLGTGTASAATSCAITASATVTAAMIQAGAMLTACVTTSAQMTFAQVSDSAGNQYYLAESQALTDGSYLSAFVSTCKYPVTSGTTILTITSGSAVSFAAVWGALAGVRDLEDTATASAAGNSSTASVARTYPDTSAVYLELVVVGNHGSSTTQAGMNAAPAASCFSSAVNGTLGINFAVRMAVGSASALTLSGSTGSSMPWAVLTLPFVCANQNGQIVRTNASTDFSGTTGTVTNTAGGSSAVNIDANSGYHLVKVHLAGTTGTIAVADSGGNTYTALTSASTGTQVTKIFGAPVTHALAAGWTLTVTSTVSQAYSVSGFFIPGGTAADSTGTVTVNSGSGTSVSAVIPATTNPACLHFVALGYGGTSDLGTAFSFTNGATTYSGIQLVSASSSGTSAEDDFYALQQAGNSAVTFAATLSGSTSFSVSAVSVVKTLVSGGGGASGGIGGAGTDAANGISGGGPGYTFGGKGANGITSNGNGAVGALPGGGGGGAARISGSTAYSGGSGANGMIRVTHLPPLIAFNDFLLHRPGRGAVPDLNPLVPIPAGDPPDNREYAVPQTVAGRNAAFKGTYSVLLCAASWDTAQSSRRLSVTINQYEYPGGPAVSVQATRTLTPATDIINGYVSMGAVTLPIKAVSSSNTDCYYTVSIHDTNQNDAFQDLLLLDSAGQTVLVNIAPGSAGDSRYLNYYIDEPSMEYDLGNILGSSHERDRAISVLDMAMATGGPMYITTGDNLLLAYSSKGAPNLQLNYRPRWFSDRIL